MTRSSQKQQEKFFVEEAAKLLKNKWQIEPGESPDFIIRHDQTRFGLEVAQIFNGATGSSGSTSKAAESENQKAINTIKRDFEKKTNCTLIVKILGDISSENLETIVPTLLKANIPKQPLAYQQSFNSAPGFKFYATRSLQANWFLMGDKVGFVNRNPHAVIIDAINDKAKKISQYKESAGEDIRLMLIANRIENSGKLKLTEPVSIETMGFSAVYFFSFPEEITIFENARESVTINGDSLSSHQ